MTDQELVEGCKQNNEKYQKILWEKYARKLLTTCRRYCKDEMEAEDVLMESMVKIYNNISNYRGESQLSTYLQRITINTCLNKIRSRKEFASIENVQVPEYNEVNALHKLQAEDILKLINLLPNGYKQIFNLYAIDGYSHKEISELLGIQEVTSRTQYAKARKLLQSKLQHTNSITYN